MDNRLERIKEILDLKIKHEISDNEIYKHIQEVLDSSGQHENKYLEFKLKSPENKPLWKHLAALSFEGFGYILLGVDDKNAKIIGMEKNEFDQLYKKMLQKEGDSKIGVWSWNRKHHLNNIFQLYDISVDATKNLFLYIFEIHSKSSIMWTEGEQFWYRNHDETRQLKSNLRLAEKLFEKFGMTNLQNNIQDIFNHLIGLIKYMYITVNLYQESNDKNIHGRYFRQESNSIPYKEMGITRLTSNSTNLELGFNETIYTISLTTPHSYTKRSEGAIKRKHIGKEIEYITDLLDIRPFFQEYSDYLTRTNNLKIVFNPFDIPVNSELIIKIIQEIKEDLEKLNFTDIIQKKWNWEFIARIGNRWNNAGQIILRFNIDNDKRLQSITFQNDYSLTFQQKGKRNEILITKPTTKDDIKNPLETIIEFLRKVK